MRTNCNAAIHEIIGAHQRGIDAAGIQGQLAERYPDVLRANKNLLLRVAIHALIESQNREETARRSAPARAAAALGSREQSAGGKDLDLLLFQHDRAISPDFRLGCDGHNLLMLSDAFIHEGSEVRNTLRRTYTQWVKSKTGRFSSVSTGF